MKTTVKENTGLLLDQANRTRNVNKGDLCKKLMVDHIEMKVSLVPQRFQENFKDLICCLWVILFVYNSKSRVKVDKFKDLCIQEYETIFNGFHFNN